MSAESFEAAYLHWLKRPDRTQREPDEPDPKDHGMEPTRHKSGSCWTIPTRKESGSGCMWPGNRRLLSAQKTTLRMIFESEFYCDPSNRNELILYDAIEEYFDRAEKFDRSICSGPIIDGSIVPMTLNEISAISKNALSVWNEIKLRLERSGFSRKAIEAARRNVAKNYLRQNQGSV